MTATLSRSTFIGLRCKECGHPYEAGARHVCEDVCFGPLEVVYDYDAIRSRVSRATIEAGPTSMVHGIHALVALGNHRRQGRRSDQR